jgi:hypothetical protein
MQMNHECAYFEELHVFQRDCATITPSTRTLHTPVSPLHFRE